MFLIIKPIRQSKKSNSEMIKGRVMAPYGLRLKFACNVDIFKIFKVTAASIGLKLSQVFLIVK